MYRILSLVLFTSTVHAAPSVSPILEVDVYCPDEVSLYLEDFTPGGTVAIIGGAGAGGEYLTAGPCRGTYVLLDGPIELVDTVTFRPSLTGGVELTIPLEAAECGGDIGAIQAIDLTTCETSWVFEL